VFRLSARADPTFLAEMLYEAVYWRDDGAEERPPLDELLARPETARYITEWGRPGDAAVFALDRRDEPVGAAWFRHFTAAAPGYGYVADDIPELAIAVFPEFRGQRVGSLLLGSLIAKAQSQGERGLSLSVNRENPARRLYARHGFEVVAEHGDAFTMLLEFETSDDD
jgi:ribosomal protein S18 acetylase RimI-like enzyme